ncbi:MAG: hypothetical protein COT15_00520 [Candidatus Diapherotrites archaeon CG08_land_8_20_14_0_20_34_12]|nr:MAG: hypothetical protein COT15_00520 [Candidatus Diapherotrites archaeon CG08_land_8_20_14_0_20_34_12]
MLLVLFIFSYALLYAFTFFNFLSNIPILNLIFPFAVWDSPMYWLLPIVGFWFVYLGISWFNKEFESELATKWVFPIIYFIFSIFAFYINLFMYLIGSVSGREIIICLFDCDAIRASIIQAGTQQNFIVMDYWPALKASAFLPFLFAGIFAWLSIYILKKLEEKEYI